MVNRLRRAPAEIFRVKVLRLLLEEVRARYPAIWRYLVDSVLEAGRNVDRIWVEVLAWGDSFGLTDDDGWLPMAAWPLLLEEPTLGGMNYGDTAIVALGERLGGYAVAPRPVPIPTLWLGWNQCLTVAELRRQALAATERAIDDALANWQEAADAAGLPWEPEARSEAVHAEWTVRHLVGRETLAGIAATAGVDARSVRAAVKAMRKRAGLPVRGRGRPKK